MACSYLPRGLPGFSGPPGPQGPQGPPGPGGDGNFPAFFLEVATEFIANDVPVAPVPGHQFTSVQDAIEYATTLPLADLQTVVIWIAPGIYTENITLYENIFLMGCDGPRNTIIIGTLTFNGTVACSVGLSELTILAVDGTISFINQELTNIQFDRVFLASDIFNVGDGSGTSLFTFIVNDSSIAASTIVWNSTGATVSGFRNSSFGDGNSIINIGTITSARINFLNSALAGSLVTVGSPSGGSEFFMTNCSPINDTSFVVNEDSVVSFYGTRINQTLVTGAGTARFDMMQAVLTIGVVEDEYFFEDPYDPTGGTGAGFGTVGIIQTTNYNVILTPYSVDGTTPISIGSAMVLFKGQSSIRMVSSVEQTYLVTILTVDNFATP